MMKMNISQLQKEIIRLKEQNNACILAHGYVAHEIIEIADFTGDSYKLSVDASKVSNKTIIMCGVRFMAETCKLLSPDKKGDPRSAHRRLCYGGSNGQADDLTRKE